MSARAAIDAADLHDDAFARDPFSVWERLRHAAPLFHDAVDDVYLLTRCAGVAAGLRDDVACSTWMPPLRMHQHHLTIPSLRVTLANEGAR